MPRMVSAKLSPKALEVLQYIEECRLLSVDALDKWKLEVDLRATGCDGVADANVDNKKETYRAVMERRQHVSEIIAAAPMTTRHKRIMSWRYIKGWKLRYIASKCNRTISWVLAQRLEALRAMAIVFDKIEKPDG